MKLAVLGGRYALCRLPPDATLPDWAADAAEAGAFFSLTRSADELSIVCDEAVVPPDVKQDRGWRCLKLEGPLALDLTGVLASVLEPLAAVQVSIFAIATFDTDYVLVRAPQLELALAALRRAGHDVEQPTD